MKKTMLIPVGVVVSIALSSVVGIALLGALPVSSSPTTVTPPTGEKQTGTLTFRNSSASVTEIIFNSTIGSVPILLTVGFGSGFSATPTTFTVIIDGASIGIITVVTANALQSRTWATTGTIVQVRAPPGSGAFHAEWQIEL